jgi:hypothetical protein
VSALDSEGRTIWIADAHRGDGKRFVVRADEKLTAFLELEAVVSIAAPIRAAGMYRKRELLRHVSGCKTSGIQLTWQACCDHRSMSSINTPASQKNGKR